MTKKKIKDLIDMSELFKTGNRWFDQPGTVIGIHFDPDTEDIIEEVLLGELMPEYHGWDDDEREDLDALTLAAALQNLVNENMDEFDLGIVVPSNSDNMCVIGYRTLARDHERYTTSLTPLMDAHYPQRTWEKVAPEDVVELPEDSDVSRQGWGRVLGFEYSLRKTQDDVRSGQRLQNWDETEAILTMCDLGQFLPSHEMETIGFPADTPHRAADHPNDENRILVTVYPEGQEPEQFSAVKSHGFLEKFHPKPTSMM